jgi:hypothetical protein
MLQALETEKQKTLQQLQDQHNEAVKLSKEKQEMCVFTSQLQGNLKEIEDKTQSLLDAKRISEER